MEFANGGELFDQIVQNGRLTENQTKRHLLQVLSGIEYIHSLGIAHRDIKPENLLLDYDQSIKLVDFGLSNLFKNGEFLKTACGSPCYASPEMIAGQLYSGPPSDIWSCGVVMYALLCGQLPFEDNNTAILYKKILSGIFKIPDYLSPSAKNLITKLLDINPETRISIEQIRQHPWFANVTLPIEASTGLQRKGIIVGQDEIAVTNLDTSEGETLEKIIYYIENNKHNQWTTSYYLLLKKHLKKQYALKEEQPFEEWPNCESKYENFSIQKCEIKKLFLESLSCEVNLKQVEKQKTQKQKWKIHRHEQSPISDFVLQKLEDSQNGSTQTQEYDKVEQICLNNRKTINKLQNNPNQPLSTTRTRTKTEKLTHKSPQNTQKTPNCVQSPAEQRNYIRKSDCSNFIPFSQKQNPKVVKIVQLTSLTQELQASKLNPSQLGQQPTACEVPQRDLKIGREFNQNISPRHGFKAKENQSSIQHNLLKSLVREPISERNDFNAQNKEANGPSKETNSKIKGKNGQAKEFSAQKKDLSSLNQAFTSLNKEVNALINGVNALHKGTIDQRDTNLQNNEIILKHREIIVQNGTIYPKYREIGSQNREMNHFTCVNNSQTKKDRDSAQNQHCKLITQSSTQKNSTSKESSNQEVQQKDTDFQIQPRETFPHPQQRDSLHSQQANEIDFSGSLQNKDLILHKEVAKDAVFNCLQKENRQYPRNDCHSNAEAQASLKKSIKINKIVTEKEKAILQKMVQAEPSKIIQKKKVYKDLHIVPMQKYPLSQKNSCEKSVSLEKQEKKLFFQKQNLLPPTTKTSENQKLAQFYSPRIVTIKEEEQQIMQFEGEAFNVNQIVQEQLSEVLGKIKTLLKKKCIQFQMVQIINAPRTFNLEINQFLGADNCFILTLKETALRNEEKVLQLFNQLLNLFSS